MGVKRSCRCCSVIVALVAVAVAGIRAYLQIPKNAEAVVRAIAKFGGIPETTFDHLEVVDPSAWYDVLTMGNLGVAEAYMHGKLNMDPLPFFLSMMNGTSIGTRSAEATDSLRIAKNIISLPSELIGLFTNQQTRSHAVRVTKQHYDAGTDLYARMLGPSMMYSCAYWKDASNLDEAQFNKLNLIRRKLELSPGMKVLDLGMGFGTAAAYMHREGNVEVTGVSLSKEQVKWAQANLAKSGLVFVMSDYRDHCEDPSFAGHYDRLYSIGFLEHVGYQNYDYFFKCIKKLLKPDGLAVVHTIGYPDFLSSTDEFLEKYIFPGGVIPAMSSLTAAYEKHFILEDWQNFGYDYAQTLAAWSVNSKAYFEEKPDAYSFEFQRMWDYYLKMCEALFEVRITQLWHFVLSPRPATRSRIQRQL